MTITRKAIKKHIIVSCVLVAGLCVSCIAMQMAYNSGNRQLTRLYAVCSVILCIAGSLSVFIHAARYVERKYHENTRVHTDIVNTNRDYRARYSLKSRITFFVLTVGSASFAAFTYAYSQHYLAKVLMSAILLFCIVTVYRYCFTTVWFTDRLIVVEVKLFAKYSESYKSVTAMHARPGNLQILFEDGRKLNLPSSLGDSDKIAAILEKHVEILPDSGIPGPRNPRT